MTVTIATQHESDVTVRKLTVDEVVKMAEVGIIGEFEHVELDLPGLDVTTPLAEFLPPR